MVNIGVRASDKVVWLKKKLAGKKTKKKPKTQYVVVKTDIFYMLWHSWGQFMKSIEQIHAEMERGGINASTIPSITQAVVRCIDEQTSRSSLQRDTEMAFNKTA